MLRISCSCSMCVLCIYALTVATCDTLMAARADSKTEPQAVVTPVPSDLDWKPIARDERIKTLGFLQTQLKANFEKIQTWSGEYYGRQEQKLTPSFVKGLFAGGPSKDGGQGLFQEFVVGTKFVIDMSGNRIFRERDVETMRFLTIDGRKPVVIPRTGPVEARTIVTDEHYIWFRPSERIITRVELPDDPRARDKQAARRDPVSETVSEKGDLFNPRELFALSNPRGNAAGELNVYIRSLKGEGGPEEQTAMESKLVVDRAEQQDRTWYRVRYPATADVVFTSIFLSSAGYNPVLVTVSSDLAGEHTTSIKRWAWASVDGIFVPSAFSFYFRSHPDDRDYQNVLELSLRDCQLNQKLSPDQFTYRALGMKEGALVLDKIDKVVYMMENGDPVKIANFGEKYIPPGEGWTTSKRNIAIAVNVLVIVVILLVWRKVRNSTRVAQGA